jgi:hypothetical protein
MMLSFGGLAQSNISQYTGTYADPLMANGEFSGTTLEIRANGTFLLRTIDPVYPRTFEQYTNEGHWVARNREIILNPDLPRRKPSVSIKEKQTGLNDSIEIKINHYNEIYQNQLLLTKQPVAFDILTLYINNRKNYWQLTGKEWKEGSCAWAPRIRNKVKVRSDGSFRIPKSQVEKIGIYTYGFTEFIELKIGNSHSDSFEIDVIVPVDQERMPRNKKVLLRANRAYFYELNGKVRKHLTPLRKMKKDS